MYLADIGDVLALFDFKLVVHLLPIIGDGIYTMGAGKSFPQRLAIIDIALRGRNELVYDNTQSAQTPILTVTHSTPLADKAWAIGFEGSLVIPLILNSDEAVGSERTDLITLPPWFPVAPKTTSIFFPDIVAAPMGSRSRADQDQSEQLTKRLWWKLFSPPERFIY